MAKQLLVLLFSLCVWKTQAQNLLANGNFEDRNICTEFRSGCAPEAWFRFPLSAVTASMGTAGFFRGNRFESIVIENLQHAFTLRSFLYTRILCPLDSGKIYRFRSSFRADSRFGFEHVDILLLPFEPYRNKQKLAQAKQKFTITEKQKLSNGQNDWDWSAFGFEFMATGKERYLVIGNFSKDPLPGKYKMGQDVNVIYDLDDVSLSSVEDSAHDGCKELSANTALLYINNSRHTPFNYLDEEPEVSDIPAKDSLMIITASPPTKPKPEINDTLVIPDVLFRFNSSELNPVFSGRLDSLITQIKSRHFKNIEVIGHTDSLGTSSFNQSLSIHRAETVKNYLIAQLESLPSSITTKGMGATIPVSSNRTSVGRQKNRRVEIVLIK